MYSVSEKHESNGKTLVWVDGQPVGHYVENGDAITAVALNGNTATFTKPFHSYYKIHKWLSLNA